MPPPPPPAPGPPPPPPPSSGLPPPPDAGRTALLGSIEGFSKGKLKKAQTNDRSAPITTAESKSSPFVCQPN